MTLDPRMTQRKRQRAQVGCLLAPAWPDLPQGRQRGSREAERGGKGAQGSTLLSCPRCFFSEIPVRSPWRRGGREGEPLPQAPPLREAGSWNSVYAQIGKLHLIDWDGVALRLAIGCSDGS